MRSVWKGFRLRFVKNPPVRTPPGLGDVPPATGLPPQTAPRCRCARDQGVSPINAALITALMLVLLYLGYTGEHIEELRRQGTIG